MYSNRLLLRAIAPVIATAAAALACPAHAVSVSWDNPAGGNWANASNWSDDQLPTTADFVEINLPGGVVTSDAANNSALELTSRTTLDVAAGLLTVQGVTAGGAPVGTLDNRKSVTVRNGAALQTDRILSSGTFMVQDAGTQATVGQGIYNNAGTFNIATGATVSAESVDNFAAFAVTGAATFTINSAVNHTAASWETSGKGTSVTNTGALTNRGSLTVGAAAGLSTGSLDNLATAEVTAGATLGFGSISNAVGASLVAGGAKTALTGNGNILNRGTVTLEQGATASANGYIQYDGSTHLDGARLAALVGNSFLAGSLSGIGTLGGATLVDTAASVAAGIAAGEVGQLDFDAGLTLAGTALFDIAGLASGSFDRLVADGAVQLSGRLNVALAAGYTPAIGDSFDIIRGQSVFGTFDTTLLPVFLGRTFDVIYGADFVRLTTAAASFVPLPLPLVLLATGLVALLPCARRRPGALAT